MAKPIFIIIAPEAGNTAIELPKGGMPDYHILYVQSPNVDKIEFKMFSDKEIEPIQIEQLKELIAKNSGA